MTPPAATRAVPDRTRRHAWLPWALAPLLLAAPGLLPAQKAPGDEERKQQEAEAKRPMAPELDGGVAWLNSAGPVRLKDLRGKIVILDFWTLCCINCIHTLPDLARLEKKYANELVVVGIHSPKFDNERSSESIRKAILRYEINHPVVNDADRKIWDTYGPEAWPTLFLIDPEGRVVGKASGEGLFEVLDEHIGKLVKQYKEKKTLDDKPRKFELARSSENGESPLFFPGKVLADGPGKRLFIADSTHHRVVVTDLDGNKIAVAGVGTPGLKDGPFDKAQFDDPQGLAVHGQTVYVADRKNHCIRELDLAAKTVKTIAGTGEQGHDREDGGPALKVGLNSPWDLLLKDDTLYVAMAGHHQIWALDLKKGELRVHAGSGAERLRDGPLVGPQGNRFRGSAFAQPSGLTSDGTTLFVADSEVSGVRALPLAGRGEVRTLVGQDLFEFGDVDGVGDDVRLQHALGVVYVDGKLYVADTYNSKVKVLDPQSRECKTFLGGEPRGWLGQPLFNEPGGISYADGKLYLADTNAHRIRVVDLKTKAVSTLKLKGVEAPKPVKP
jgi:thiol-disulfide isomerase/thioredoxin